MRRHETHLDSVEMRAGFPGHSAAARYEVQATPPAGSTRTVNLYIQMDLFPTGYLTEFTCIIIIIC
jgi:hypothetical protein